MNETFISFYLRANRVHIFVDALRGIGEPKYICFMIEENGKTLALTPYPQKDFYSHRVPYGVYNGSKSMEVSSKRLCRIIAGLYKWDVEASYRVPGVILPKQDVVLFYLTEAEVIEHDEMFFIRTEITEKFYQRVASNNGRERPPAQVWVRQYVKMFSVFGQCFHRC